MSSSMTSFSFTTPSVSAASSGDEAKPLSVSFATLPDEILGTGSESAASARRPGKEPVSALRGGRDSYSPPASSRSTDATTSGTYSEPDAPTPAPRPLADTTDITKSQGMMRWPPPPNDLRRLRALSSASQTGSTPPPERKSITPPGTDVKARRKTYALDMMTTSKATRISNTHNGKDLANMLPEDRAEYLTALHKLWIARKKIQMGRTAFKAWRKDFSAAALELDPYLDSEKVLLRAGYEIEYGRDGQNCVVTAPDGLTIEMDPTPPHLMAKALKKQIKDIKTDMREKEVHEMKTEVLERKAMERINEPQLNADPIMAMAATRKLSQLSISEDTPTAYLGAVAVLFACFSAAWAVPMLIFGLVHSPAKCDSPINIFLIVVGTLILVTCFLSLANYALEYYEDTSLKCIKYARVIIYAIIVIFAFAGIVWLISSETCKQETPGVWRMSVAAIILILVLLACAVADLVCKRMSAEEDDGEYSSESRGVDPLNPDVIYQSVKRL